MPPYTPRISWTYIIYRLCRFMIFWVCQGLSNWIACMVMGANQFYALNNVQSRVRCSSHIWEKDLRFNKWWLFTIRWLCTHKMNEQLSQWIMLLTLLSILAEFANSCSRSIHDTDELYSDRAETSVISNLSHNYNTSVSTGNRFFYELQFCTILFYYSWT